MARERLQLAVNQAARKQAEKWNKAHPVGAEVEVSMPDGTTRRTRTRTPAMYLFVQITQAMVYVEGFGSLVGLSRIKAV